MDSKSQDISEAKTSKKLPIYIAWSGGCDSSLALIWALRQRHNTDVYAVSIEHSCLSDNKIKHENRVREQFIKIHTIENYNVKHCTFKIDQHAVSGYGNNQSSIWVGSIIPCLPAKCELMFGYIKEDDFWHLKHEFELAAHSLHKLHHGNDTELLISYPLEWYTKLDVVRELERTELLSCDENFWWCEGSEDLQEPCGECQPCKKMIIAKNMLKEEDAARENADFIICKEKMVTCEEKVDIKEEKVDVKTDFVI